MIENDCEVAVQVFSKQYAKASKEQARLHAQRRSLAAAKHTRYKGHLEIRLLQMS